MAPSGTNFEGGALGGPQKVQALLGAALDLSGEHELETVLRRIVAGAATIAGAGYAALGIYDKSGEIESFIYHGVDDDAVARIGALPHGRGLLGEVIVADGPIRLEDLGGDARSCGFPANHPPMRSFLGVPVARSGRRYGNLYVTEKAGGAPFDNQDEALVVAFAAFAVGAIESARLVQSERAQAEALADFARFQRTVDLVWPRIGGGCHTSRPTDQVIDAAGFVIERARRFTFRPAISAYPVSPHVLGLARRHPSDE